ncbi:MAG: hypothetical protein JNL81_01620 [Hyphomonadaceae bacterium]|nr:hypothetical protein [Hyphomonadaceae bacterium]
MFDHGVRHLEAYIDFLSAVILCAPDRFPKESFLKDDQQLNLDRAFALLNDRFGLVEDRVKKPEILPRLRELLDAALVAYRQGEEVRGAHLVQDFRGLILESVRR